MIGGLVESPRSLSFSLMKKYSTFLLLKNMLLKYTYYTLTGKVDDSSDIARHLYGHTHIT